MLFLCDFSVNFLLLARVIIMNPENKTADVNAFMKQLDHPLKDAIEADSQDNRPLRSNKSFQNRL